MLYAQFGVIIANRSALQSRTQTYGQSIPVRRPAPRASIQRRAVSFRRPHRRRDHGDVNEADRITGGAIPMIRIHGFLAIDDATARTLTARRRLNGAKGNGRCGQPDQEQTGMIAWGDLQLRRNGSPPAARGALSAAGSCQRTRHPHGRCRERTCEGNSIDLDLLATSSSRNDSP